VDKQKNIPSGIKLGSLFDGIGGFPYAGIFFGIKPLWASEIMDQAVSVTMRHLPGMVHVGDITKLHGWDLPPVDIITFGSPCQDLSTAGKRAGIGGERSNLFYEAIRIIYEMREATNGQYPRYAVWENVPGALSSGKPPGSDYQAVLEAFTKTEVPIPRSGKWANAGMVRGNGVDLAWCIYNAQHFGVPQRRRRIFLVCDFGGGSAGEILFVAKSLSGYFAARRAQGQSPAADALRGADGASISANVNDTAATLFAGYGNHWNGNAGAYDGGNFALSPNCLTPWDTQQSRVFTDDGTSPTLAGADGGGGRNPGGLVLAAFLGGAGEKARSIGYSETTSPTLKSGACGFNAPCLCEPKPVATFMGDSSPSSYGIEYMEEAAPTLKPRLSGTPCLCEPKLCTVINDQGGDSLNIEKTDISPTLRSETHGNLPIVSLCAVGVHQNQCGDIHVADTAYSLATNGNATGRNAPLVCANLHAFSLDSAESNSMKSSNPLSGCREVGTARTLDSTNPCPSKNQGGIAVVEVHPKVSGTLMASGAGLSRPARMASETDLCIVVPNSEPIPIQDKATRCNGGGETRNGDGCGNGLGVGKSGDPAPTITSGDRHAVAAYCLQGNMIGREDHNGPRGNGVNEGVSFTLNTIDHHAIAAVDCRNFCETEELSGTLQAKTTPGYSLNFQNPIRVKYIVRRLLPVECERLQGYPDGWTEFGHDGKPISDTRRYQMLGNSVAVPCVAYILMGIAEQMNPPIKPVAPCAAMDSGEFLEVAA